MWVKFFLLSEGYHFDPDGSVTTMTLRAETMTEWHNRLSSPQYQRQCHYLGYVGL